MDAGLQGSGRNSALEWLGAHREQCGGSVGCLGSAKRSWAPRHAVPKKCWPSPSSSARPGAMSRFTCLLGQVFFPRFGSRAYSRTGNNCVDFASEFLRELGAEEVPSWCQRGLQFYRGAAGAVGFVEALFSTAEERCGAGCAGMLGGGSRRLQLGLGSLRVCSRMDPSKM